MERISNMFIPALIFYRGNGAFSEKRYIRKFYKRCEGWVENSRRNCTDIDWTDDIGRRAARFRLFGFIMQIYRKAYRRHCAGLSQ